MDEEEKEIEEYFNKYIKPYLVDENKLKCKRCGWVSPYHNMKSIVMHIKKVKGELLCGICKEEEIQLPIGIGKIIIVRTTKKVTEDYAFKFDETSMNLTEYKAIELAKKYAGMTGIEITSHTSASRSKVVYSEKVSDVKAETDEIIER